MDVEMSPITDTKRKRTASAAQSDGALKKQKLSNVRKIAVPPHRLIFTIINYR
jgi:hypothetical protein